MLTVDLIWLFCFAIRQIRAKLTRSSIFADLQYIVRIATNPNLVSNISRVQTEIDKDPRVHRVVSWSTKSTRLQNDIGIPPIQPPESQESPPWEDQPYMC